MRRNSHLVLTQVVVCDTTSHQNSAAYESVHAPMRVLVLLLLLSSTQLYAQPDTIANRLVLSLQVNYGRIYVHTRVIRNLAGSAPRGLELSLSKQAVNDSIWNLCNCYPRTGVVAAYNDFNNPILGKGVVLSYFLEPTYRINKKLSISFRGNLGISYLTNPFDPVDNPVNRAYSLRVNPYMQLGVGAAYRLNKYLSLVTGGDFRHISNGGLKAPNTGINWLTASAGLLYYPQSNELPVFKKRYNPFWKEKKGTIDAGVMYVPPQGYSGYLKATRNYLAGVFVQYTKHIGRTSGLTGGAEVYYTKIEVPSSSTERKDPSGIYSGVHAGHAFLLNRFVFRQQLGVYLQQAEKIFTDSYIRLGIDYRFHPHFLVGANMKAHTDNADFFDLRLMYRL